jgi:trk/ktr system potassium uptake protein
MNPVKRLFQRLPPGQILIFYYTLAILLGTLLLCLPLAAQGDPLSFLDALFTATSAQCVTGLTVLDTGTRLSGFGQLVVLILIQVGGLGITTFSVYLFYVLRHGVGMRGRLLIQETLAHTAYGSVRELVRAIFLLTLAIEGVGALLLALRFVPEQGWVAGLYSAVFHSVSAFCNAGFSLRADSLVGYQGDALVNLTIIGLITLGGIGFLVIHELLGLLRRRSQKNPRRRLSLHARLVLVTSAALTFGGALVIWLLESRSSLHYLNGLDGFWTVLFQSVTARTAGFNSIDLNAFEVPTLFFIMFLMFVGASPGSCGGGIKTTSLALFVAILHSRLRGDEHTNVFKRTIPDELATRTLTLVLLAGLICSLAIFLLLTVQIHGLPFRESRGTYLEYTFEAVSAFATVGLSLGVTAKLVPLAKLIVIGLMFIGRVGLLTVAFAIVRRSRGGAVRYGEETIMIG